MVTRQRIVMGVAIAALAAVAYTARIRHEMIDFVTWRQAAVRALAAEPLYRPEDGHYQFKYFPAYAVLMAPFGLVGEETGKVLWFASSVVLLIALVGWSIAALPDRRTSATTLLWITLLLMAKFYAHELLLGQVNLLLGALLLGALLAVRSDRQIAAGALVGLGVFVKPYALILVPWLLATGRARAVSVALAVIGGGLALPAVVYGWNGNLVLLRDWFRTVTDSTAPNLLGNDNVSIAAMWAKWIAPGALASVLAWLTISAVLGLAVFAWFQRHKSRAPDYLEFALLTLLIPLISPQGWDYVLLLGTPAVVCLVDRWRELGAGWRWGLALALGTMAFAVFDLLGRELYGRFMALSVITVCALVIAAGLVRARVRALA